MSIHKLFENESNIIEMDNYTMLLIELKYSGRTYDIPKEAWGQLADTANIKDGQISTDIFKDVCMEYKIMTPILKFLNKNHNGYSSWYIPSVYEIQKYDIGSAIGDRLENNIIASSNFDMEGKDLKIKTVEFYDDGEDDKYYSFNQNNIMFNILIRRN